METEGDLFIFHCEGRCYFHFLDASRTPQNEQGSKFEIESAFFPTKIKDTILSTQVQQVK
jgi:hypothetical protein